MRKILLFIIAIVFTTQSFCQTKYPMDSTLFANYKYRNIGPFRGGRASGVCGDYKNKSLYYMATTGGGLWKTLDGGNNWKNISDKYFGGSIGSVEVAPNDPLVLYVGTGESTLRGNVSEGHGMYKSTDGGKTWKFIGLQDTRHITKIIVHPKNSDVVYVCATGHLFGKNSERGVFKTINGGATWSKILFVNDEVGAVDMQMDNTNPDIMYASTWRVKRTPYSMESGGEGCGLWKTTDAGVTWKNISKNKGLPKDTLGNIGIAIAPSNTDKIYVIIESKTGGLFMSEDAGDTWTKQSDESKIRQRSWYFNKLYVDPKNENLVYVCNVEFHKSTDGGKTFSTISTPHSDHHGLWIDPENGQRMIIADDGGAQVSVDGGSNWSTYNNQPTAQFYRVTCDNHFPYHVLGCQQDNSSVRILSRSNGGSISQQDWESSAGFESGHIVADPLNNDIVYGGNYGGYLSRYNHKTNEYRTVSVYPESPIGSGADTLKYRFQWNFPIFFSPHNPKRLYAAGNHLFMSENEGQNWTKISPDLTTNNKIKQKPSGGIITKDNTGVEYYCTIFAAAESPVQKDILWCGSDDGLIHISKDGGVTWNNVTSSTMPQTLMINCIEPSTFDAGTCYIVGTSYKSDDYTPYIYKTTDFGARWTKITNGIAPNHFARCLRADPVKKDFLYAGTEFGMYISIDDGTSWKPFQLNLPIVPITDLCIKNNDLVVATQGRSFWILDDLTYIHQTNENIKNKNLFMFNPAISYRTNGYLNKNAKNEGENLPNGVVLNYWLNETIDTAQFDIFIFDKNEKLIHTISNKGKHKQEGLPLEKGMNKYIWSTLVKGSEKTDDMTLWNGAIGQFKVPPGTYKFVINTGKESSTVMATINANPNFSITTEEYEAQYNFLKQARDKFEETQTCIKNMRDVKKQFTTLKEKIGKDYPKDLDSMATNISKQMNVIEENLYQTKAKSGQDLLNYPIRLNDKLSGIFDAANQNTAPSNSVLEAYKDVVEKIDLQLNSFKNIQEIDIKKFNTLVREKEIGLIQVSKNEE